MIQYEKYIQYEEKIIMIQYASTIIKFCLVVIIKMHYACTIFKQTVKIVHQTNLT